MISAPSIRLSLFSQLSVSAPRSVPARSMNEKRPTSSIAAWLTAAVADVPAAGFDDSCADALEQLDASVQQLVVGVVAPGREATALSWLDLYVLEYRVEPFVPVMAGNEEAWGRFDAGVRIVAGNFVGGARDPPFVRTARRSPRAAPRRPASPRLAPTPA